MGAGVQGLAEAPWLDLDALGPNEPDQLATSQLRVDRFAAGPSGADQYSGGLLGDAGSHTLIVPREDMSHGDGGRHHVRREPLLQRWLFSPRLLAVAAIVALGIGLGVGGWWLTSGRYGSVPQVSNDSVSRATAVLTAAGFKVKTGGQVHSNQVSKGMVVGTSPAGRVAKGSVITLVVSAGPFTSVVPSVNGLTLSAAQAKLQQVHLTSSPQNVASDSPVGTVLRTDPAAGATVPQTKTVTIFVVAGPPLPNFTGQSLDQAKTWAAQHGVTLVPRDDTNSQQPQGTITGQEPAAGTLFHSGDTVTVNVSTGPQIVNVPDVIGLSAEQATQQLQSMGFQVKVNMFTPVDRVFDFAPVGQAPRGSTITLDVGF